MRCIFDKNGYITLLSTLVVGAIGLAVSLTLILLGLGSARTSFALEQSNQAKALANACAEEALQQIRSSTDFQGTNNLTLGQGGCIYMVIKLAGENREIRASGSVGTTVRRVQISLNQINPNINLTSWQEVADFNP